MSIRNQTLFILGCKTGYRVSALLSLKVKDVWQHDAPTPQIYVAKRFRKMGKSKGKFICKHCFTEGPLPKDFDEICPECGKPVKVIKPKKAEGRAVPLNDAAKSAIDTLISHYKKIGCYDPETYLFRSRKGNVPLSRSSAWRIISDAAWHARIPGKIGTHSMRKTFAKNVFEKLDRDLLKTKQALGHQSVDSTIQYLQQDQEEINNVILDL